MDYQKFIQASQQLERAAAAKRASLRSAMEREVAEALKRGDRHQAARTISTYLERNPGAAQWWHELATVLRQEGDEKGAHAAWRQALATGLGDAALLFRIAQALTDTGLDAARIAEEAWTSLPETHALSIAGDRAPSMPDLAAACLAVLRSDWDHARSALVRIMHAQPANRQAARNLIFVLEHLGQHGAAQCVGALHSLARGDAQEAVRAFEAAPASDAHSHFFLGEFVRALRSAGNEERAIQLLESIPPASIPRVAYVEWASILMDLDRQEEAIETLNRGSIALDDPGLELQARLILPAVPRSQEAMEQAHQRVRKNILALAKADLPVTPEALRTLERSLGPNFFLPYMGDPCVEEARSYGAYAERVMQAAFPQFSSLAQRHRKPGEPIRIGCATSLVNHHVVMKCFAGWLERPDRNAFEIHIFPLATEQTQVTDYLARLVDFFHAPTLDTEEAARQIREAKLDLLVYPEIGIDALSFRLAAMRLAPVQCAAAGHPMTTGLSTIDFFLSAAAAEPADASAHYTEQLVTLPGMGVFMPHPAVPGKPGSREDFGLPAHQTIYLSTQNLFKHLPLHDQVFPRIAEIVDDACFVFIEGHYPAWTRTFFNRLREAFSSRGLQPDRYLRLLPRQPYDRYLALHLLSDVCLDPPGGFSGGMTSRDALACGLPLVTMRGSLMRNRQGFGLLAELGLEDSVAADLDDYVKLAASLGLDKNRRAGLSRQILERRHLLFDDIRCLLGLENFFRWAAGSDQPVGEDYFTLHFSNSSQMKTGAD